MPEIGSVFHPAPPSQQYLIELVRAQYQIWREEKDAKEPKFVIENIRFEHDPEWRNRLMSIQCMHDGNLLVWRFAKVAYIAGAAAPYVVKMFF